MFEDQLYEVVTVGTSVGDALSPKVNGDIQILLRIFHRQLGRSDSESLGDLVGSAMGETDCRCTESRGELRMRYPLAKLDWDSLLGSPNRLGGAYQSSSADL